MTRSPGAGSRRLAVLACGVLLAGATGLSACDCLGELPSVDHAYSNAGALFEGRAVSRDPEGGPSRLVTLLVANSWRGGLRRDQMATVRTMGCGLEFRPGERYIVYADSYAEQLSTGRCDRTAVATDEERAILDARASEEDPWCHEPHGFCDEEREYTILERRGDFTIWPRDTSPAAGWEDTYFRGPRWEALDRVQALRSP